MHVHHGDCNEILTRDIFPLARYEDRRRALCLLDPFNINLSWHVVAHAGHMRSVEVFVNFMVMDMNMNVLLTDPGKADEAQIRRMDRFWGDDSWREVAYEVSRQQSLFGGEPEQMKAANEKISEAYRERLTKVAGFAYAPHPLRFVNSHKATIYYLFFASPNETGGHIVEDIFTKHKKRQGL